MPDWPDILAQYETETKASDGMLVKNGRLRHGDSRTRLEDAIEGLAPGIDGGLLRDTVARLMGYADPTGPNGFSSRANADLITPAMATKIRPGSLSYLTNVTTFGRSGKGETRKTGALEGGPLGVHVEDGTAPSERLLGWALVAAPRAHADPEHQARPYDPLIAQVASPLLKGTIDDPARAAALDLTYRPNHGLPIEPGDALLAQLDRLETIYAEAVRLAVAHGLHETVVKRLLHHAGTPLLLRETPYGFARVAPGARELAPTGHWRPGLDARFLDDLKNLKTRRPWVAMAFQTEELQRRAPGVLDGLRFESHPTLTGEEFAARVARRQTEGDVVPDGIMLFRGVLVNDLRVDFLIHNATSGTVVWTIAPDAERETAEMLARVVRHDTTPGREVQAMIDNLSEDYSLLNVKPKSDAMRAFLRALALAGNTRRLLDLS